MRKLILALILVLLLPGALIADENLSNYTEYEEAGNPLSVTANKVTFTDISRSADRETWLVKDFGTNYFDGNFTHQVDCRITAVNDGQTNIWALANDVDSKYDSLMAGNPSLSVLLTQNADTNYYIELFEAYDSSQYKDGYQISLNTTYSLTISLDTSVPAIGNGTAYVAIYSNDTLLDTLSLERHESIAYRYCSAIRSLGFGDVNQVISGWAESYNLGEEGRPIGFGVANGGGNHKFLY